MIYKVLDAMFRVLTCDVHQEPERNTNTRHWFCFIVCPHQTEEWRWIQLREGVFGKSSFDLDFTLVLINCHLYADCLKTKTKINRKRSLKRKINVREKLT